MALRDAVAPQVAACTARPNQEVSVTTSLELCYRGIPRTDKLDNLIREKVKKMEKFCHKLTSCRVAIEQDQSHKKSGNSLRVRIDLRMPPNHELVVNRSSLDDDEERPLVNLIRASFEAATRQLKEHMEKQKHREKRIPSHNRIPVSSTLDEGPGTFEL